MAFSLNKLKNILNTNRDSQLAGSGSLDPEIGFKLALHPVSKNLYVTVIGARHLPSLFGLSRAHGYLVKIKVFPGDSKFETTLQESSWPVWNEDFKFQLKPKDPKKPLEKDLQSQLAGHFLSLTIYAILEPRQDIDKRKNAKTIDSKKTSKLTEEQEQKVKGNFLEKTFSSFKSTKTEAAIQKSLLEKRRTVGAATWNFDSKLFQNDLKNGLIGTPDIWRPISAIASGLSTTESRRNLPKSPMCVNYTNGLVGEQYVALPRVVRPNTPPLALVRTPTIAVAVYTPEGLYLVAFYDYMGDTILSDSVNAERENKKGQLEVTLLYTGSEDGLNDTVQLTVNRLRCSVQTMQEQEQYKAPLYLKATILEANKAECYWKSDRFVPTISARWDPKSATVKLNVFKANLNIVSIYISLGCKTKMAKKEILGKAVIDEKSPYSDSWTECLRQPGIPKTFWINFE